MYILHPISTTQIHTWVAVCTLSVSLCHLAKPGSGSNVSGIVLSFVHIYEHVQRGITKVKIRNPYHRRKGGNRFYLSQKREDSKGIGDCPQI